MTRREAREQAFVLMFEKSFRPDEAVLDIAEDAYEDEQIEKDDFALMLAKKTEDNLEDIDIYIEKYSRGWSIRRIPRVSLAILRIAICEILFLDEVPVGVSINEAVELAKKYAGENDGSFINGILGSVSRDK
ncbi:MAG: transcription antitermination factor NusB [Ruminococcaceae bacterium]|nr:transcription antitermination factor NusB [Oscillospiraceae bacterium]